MPFTPTHIAAIVPLAYSKWFPFSALAIGCMIPDLPLFFPWVNYAQTHSAIGVLTVCMPLGLTAYVLFQCIIKVPLVALLPNWMQDRMTTYSSPLLKPSYLFFLGLMLAVVIGAYTHIIWDAFTHQGRWGTHWIPLLNKEIPIAGRLLPGYKIFQYGSTLIGLPLMLLLWARQLACTQPAVFAKPIRLSPVAKMSGGTILLLLPLLVALVKLITEPALHRKVFEAITTSGATLMVLIVAYSLLFQLLSSKLHDPNAASNIDV